VCVCVCVCVGVWVCGCVGVYLFVCFVTRTSLVALLKPFYWQCAIVPILPKKLINAIDSPGTLKLTKLPGKQEITRFYKLVPFFMGTCTLPSDPHRRQDFLLVDLDQHNIVKPSRVLPPLPGYHKLYLVIDPFILCLLF
jgi:DENN (AEX-3) domain